MLKSSISTSLLSLPTHKISQSTNQIRRSTKHTNQSRSGAYHPIPESNAGFHPNQPFPNQRPIYQNRGLKENKEISNLSMLIKNSNGFQGMESVISSESQWYP